MTLCHIEGEGMIQAEIHSKLNVIDFAEDAEDVSYPDLTRKEDVLTSNVFGILKNLDVTFLNEILGAANVPVHLTDDTFEIEFWPNFEDGTQPDLLIRGTDFLVVIEVKYLSDFDRGNDLRKSQILREFEGARMLANEAQLPHIYLLAVTQMDSIEWKDKVRSFDRSELTRIEPKLHSISWSQIFNIVKNTNTKDKTSARFRADLLELMENKQIGCPPPAVPKGQRDFLSIFGDQATRLDGLLKANSYYVVLSELSVEKKCELYGCIVEYIESIEKDQMLRPLGNTLSTNSIPVDLLLGVPEDEIEHWVKFMLFLFKNDHVNLNGKDDCSVKLHFNKGNYTKFPVSLFRYHRTNRIIEVQEYR